MMRKRLLTKYWHIAELSLNRDVVDARYMEEAETGTATYTGSVTKKEGLIDVVADVEGYTEENFGTGERPSDFDTDGNGIDDEWERANGLAVGTVDPSGYDIDPRKWYTNIEVYMNSLVEHIVKAQNADGDSNYTEYYPESVSTGINDATAAASRSRENRILHTGRNEAQQTGKGHQHTQNYIYQRQDIY